MKSMARSLILLFWFAAPAVAFAGEPPAPKDPGKPADPGAGSGEDEEALEIRAAKERLEKLDQATRKILDLMDKTHGGIKSFSSGYRQVRKVRIRRTPVVSSGSIHIVKRGEGAGMKVLFVEEKPSKSKVLFTDEEVVMLDCATGEIKRNDPRRGSVRPSEIWVLGRPVLDIVRFYEPKLLEPPEEDRETYLGLLELVPVSEKVRKWVKRIVIWLRPDDALGLKVRIEDRNGDYQEFDFSGGKPKINPEQDPDLYEIG